MALQNIFGDLALDETLTDGSQKTKINIGSSEVSASNPVPITSPESGFLSVKETTPVTGFATSTIQTDGTQITKIKETVPTDSSKNNSAVTISYNAAGECVYVDEIISGSTYRTTFTRSDMTVATTLPISAAVKL